MRHGPNAGCAAPFCVTTGALCGYFKNREELLDTLGKEHYEQMTFLYRTILVSFSALPPQEQEMCMQEYTVKGTPVQLAIRGAMWKIFALKRRFVIAQKNTGEHSYTERSPVFLLAK